MGKESGISPLLVFCYFLGSLPMMLTSYSALVEQVSIPENSTSLSVDVCTGTNVTWMTIVDKDLSWFESIALCKDMGFSSVDIALPSWSRRNQVRRYLEDIDYKRLNYSFWTGIFRSENYDTEWYYGFDKCRKMPDSVDMNYMRDGLCVTIGRNESSLYNESIFVDDCNTRRPFVCSTTPGEATFLAYNGFDIPSISVTTDVRPFTLTNVTSEYCKEECYKRGGCTAFSYYHDMNNCTLFRMAFANDGKKYLYYTINESVQNVTHFAKTGCQLNFTTANMTAPSNIDTTIPDCRNDEIEVHCQCNGSDASLTDDEIETIVNELVANLTVDPKATSASRRKLTSAEDSSPASKVVGTFGIIFMVVMFSLPVISDCFLPCPAIYLAVWYSPSTNEYHP